ncbi:MAG: hypothetical protein WC878_05465 [Candidatus Paceibacterota bacterium]|jgi:hypothetical protein
MDTKNTVAWYEQGLKLLQDARKKAKKMSSPEELIVLKKETHEELDHIFSERTLREEIAEDRNVRKAKAEESDLKKKYKALQEQVELLEKENAVMRKLDENHSTHVIVPSNSLGVSEATAMAILSDWHCEELVRAETVNGKNFFNLERAKKRADRCFQKIVSLTRKEQQDVTINNMVIGLLGDFISGNIHEELLENCQLRPMEAILFAQGLLESGIIFLLEETKLNLTFICHVGNHTRITKKVHISTEQGNSLESLLYSSLRQRFASEPRVKFIIAEGYHSYFDVYGTKIRFHHGHSLRYQGGVGGLTIPVNKAIAQWNKIIPVDLDIFGHWHTYMHMKNFVANGSLIGYNGFALSIKADFDVPKQAFFLIDKKLGPSIFAPIFVDK